MLNNRKTKKKKKSQSTGGAEKLLKKERIQKVMEYWNNPNKRVDSQDLVERYVKGKKLCYRENGSFYDPKDRTYLGERPRTLYRHASALYRDLTLMVNNGILDKTQENGRTSYRLTEMYKFEPIKLRHASLIRDRSMNNILFDTRFSLLLPKNITVTDFLYHKEKKGYPERYVILNDIVTKFLESLNLLLTEVCFENAAKIWQKKIIDNTKIYPPLKIHRWMKILVLLLIAQSPQYKECKKTLDDLKKSAGPLKKSLFSDILYGSKFQDVDIEQLNEKIEIDYKKNEKYINRVHEEIYDALKDNEHGIIINALIEKAGNSYIEAFNQVLKERRKKGFAPVIKEERRDLTIDYSELSKKYPEHLPDIEKRYINMGKTWLDKLSITSQKEFKNFWKELGHQKDRAYYLLGIFLLFPLPSDI